MKYEFEPKYNIGDYVEVCCKDNVSRHMTIGEIRYSVSNFRTKIEYYVSCDAGAFYIAYYDEFVEEQNIIKKIK